MKTKKNNRSRSVFLLQRNSFFRSAVFFAAGRLIVKIKQKNNEGSTPLAANIP